MFQVWNCPKVTSLPQFCTSLTYLSVRKCEGLISIADGIISSLTQLKTLRLGPFSKELEEFPGFNSIHHLSNPLLEELRLYGWDKLKLLPHQLQYFTALKKFHIQDFNGVEVLPDWLVNLSSLEYFEISNCENLQNLPKTLGGITKLTWLEIYSCPHLKKSCTQNSGADWPNICHITRIRIDFEEI